MHYLKKIIEEKLNLDLTELKKHQIDNLNEMPDDYIRNARKLNDEHQAEYYLSLIISDENVRYLRSFTRSVITNKENARMWQRRSVAFILGASIKDILTKPREVLFGFPDSKFKYIVKPDYAYLENKVPNGGILTFVDLDANYKTVAPHGYTMVLLKNTELIEIKQSDIPFHFRRWVASRIAAYLDHFNKLRIEFDPSLLKEIANKKEWTEDALKAVEGLQKERQNYAWKKKDIPGFCGKDSYYI